MTVIFDLDDTLYKEIEYVKSAYRTIAAHFDSVSIDVMLHADTVADAFDYAAMASGTGIDRIIAIYRTHIPDIFLDKETSDTLHQLQASNIKLGIITDGRAVTQSNKLKALGLDHIINPDLIFISGVTGFTKLSDNSFDSVENISASPPYIYIGDNPEKDFLIANRKGWLTVMLADNGENIHPQNLESLPAEKLPELTISSLSELTNLLIPKRL